MPDGKLVFVNNRPIAKWFDIAALTGMAAMFVGLYLYEYGVRLVGPVADIAIIVLLWLFGCVVLIRLYGPPRVRLTIDRGQVVVDERWIGPGRVERFARSRLSRPVIVEDKNSDGDPYFRCTITIPSGRTVSFSESGERAVVEAERDRLRAAVGA